MKLKQSYLLTALILASLNAHAETDFAKKLPGLSDPTPTELSEKSKQKDTSIDVGSKSTIDTKKSQVDGKQKELPPLPNIPAPKSVQQSKKEAFESTKDNIAPMTPEMVREFRKFIDEQQRAKAAAVGAPAKPVVSTLSVSLDPGYTPPVIRLAGGFVTSIVFVDASGAEWPVVKFYPGNPDVFHVEQAQEGSNVITVSTISAYAHGNLAVHLKGHQTPVMVTLVSGQKEVDYRADIHIQMRGPNAVAPKIQADYGLKVSQPLTYVLDGVAPKNSKVLLLDGKPNMAWLADGKTYIRTRMTLLSPGWIEHVTSPDGMHAYQIPDTATLLLSDENGNTVQVQLKEQTWQANK